MTMMMMMMMMTMITKRPGVLCAGVVHPRAPISPTRPKAVTCPAFSTYLCERRKKHLVINILIIIVINIIITFIIKAVTCPALPYLPV